MLGNQARDHFLKSGTILLKSARLSRTAHPCRHKIHKTYLNISKQRTEREPGTRLRFSNIAAVAANYKNFVVNPCTLYIKHDEY
jgi:hypothetical protein